MTTMIAIPPGTTIYEPDGINRVIVQFEREDDAILFFQLLCELSKERE